MSQERQSLSLRADRLGIAASALCFAHCVVTPLVLSLSSVWAHFLPSEERIHRILAVLVAGIGCLAMVSGYRRHRRSRVLLLMIVGLSAIIAGAYFGDRLPSHLAEVAVTLAGSSAMMTAHFLNHTFCKGCRCEDGH